MPNPSFEDPLIDTLPGPSICAPYWFPPTGQLGTPDYYRENALNINYNIPDNIVGYQYARAGVSYQGIGYSLTGGGANGREYLETQLSCPLTASYQYRTGFHVSLADISRFAINRIGMYFSNNILDCASCTSPKVIPGIIPQIENNLSVSLSDTANWVEISDIYTAIGGEKYITIGGFYPDSLMNIVTVSGSSFNGAYYYIDSVYVIPLNNNQISVSNDTSICAGESVQLLASGSGLYYWFKDGNFADTLGFSNTLMVSPTATTTYQLQTCISLESVVVSIIEDEVAVNLGNDTLLCNGDSLTLNAVHPNAASYLWQDNSANAAFTVSQAGIYWVRVSNQCGESVTDTVAVGLREDTVWVNLGSDTLLCDGEILILNAAHPNAVSYVWQDGSANAAFTVSQAGTYWVQINNQCGGSATDTLTSTYEGCLCDFVLPSAFTPNGDGINDEYRAVLNCSAVTSFSLRIYNRWGEKVFETDNPYMGWNGKYKNEAQPVDVYSVHISVNSAHKISSVSLVR